LDDWVEDTTPHSGDIHSIYSTLHSKVFHVLMLAFGPECMKTVMGGNINVSCLLSVLHFFAALARRLGTL